MPTKFPLESDRSVAALDLSSAQSGIVTPGIEAVDIRDDELRRFNDLAHSLNPQMPELTADQLSGVVRRVLRTAATGGQSPFIRSRMRRAAEMRAMTTDSGWRTADTHATRLHDLLAYIDDPDGLIRDDVPVVGLLDDALLVDIAMDNLRGELDDYAEYCRYRSGEAARRGIAPAAAGIDRTQWQIARDDELRLEHQLRHVRGSSYAAAGAAERVFRVC